MLILFFFDVYSGIEQMKKPLGKAASSFKSSKWRLWKPKLYKILFQFNTFQNKINTTLLKKPPTL